MRYGEHPVGKHRLNVSIFLSQKLLKIEEESKEDITFVIITDVHLEKPKVKKKKKKKKKKKSNEYSWENEH
jgi:hypothetical protein